MGKIVNVLHQGGALGKSVVNDSRHDIAWAGEKKSSASIDSTVGLVFELDTCSTTMVAQNISSF